MDVSQLTPEQIKALAEFNLAGLFVKTRVVRVIDGDTVDLIFPVSLTFLQTIDVNGKYRAYSVSSGEGIIIKRRIRLLGINTAELSTNAGKVAKVIAINRYNSVSNIVYAQMGGSDKYGRLLGTLYEDVERIKSINQYLLDYIDLTHGHIAIPYAYRALSEDCPEEDSEKHIEAVKSDIINNDVFNDY